MFCMSCAHLYYLREERTVLAGVGMCLNKTKCFNSFYIGSCCRFVVSRVLIDVQASILHRYIDWMPLTKRYWREDWR